MHCYDVIRAAVRCNIVVRSPPVHRSLSQPVRRENNDRLVGRRYGARTIRPVRNNERFSKNKLSETFHFITIFIRAAGHALHGFTALGASCSLYTVIPVRWCNYRVSPRVHNSILCTSIIITALGITIIVLVIIIFIVINTRHPTIIIYGRVAC